MDCFTRSLQLQSSPVGAVAPWMIAQLIATCANLSFIPISLLLFLNGNGNFAYWLLGWAEVRVLLVAFGTLGLGPHDQKPTHQPTDPVFQNQPAMLIHGVIQRGFDLFDSNVLPNCLDESRSICQALSYIADPKGIPLMERLAKDANDPKPPDNWSMHKLWQAAEWLRAFCGTVLPVNWPFLERVREETNDTTSPSDQQ